MLSMIEKIERFMQGNKDLNSFNVKKLRKHILSNNQERANYYLNQVKINKENIQPDLLEQSIKYGNLIAVLKIIENLNIKKVTFKTKSRYETAILNGLFDCILGLNSTIKTKKDSDYKITTYLFSEIIDVENMNEEHMINIFNFIMKLKNMNLMEYMMKFDRFVKYIVNNKEFIPLHKAAESGNILLFKALVVKGADLSHKDTYGYTPLIYASHFNKTDIIDLIINYFNYKPKEEELAKIRQNFYVYTINKLNSQKA